MPKNISKIIEDCCKQCGIDYNSPYLKNPKIVKAIEDGLLLRNIYVKLKEIASDLQEISERHEINGLNKLLEDDIRQLEKADHDILKIAKKIAKEQL